MEYRDIKCNSYNIHTIKTDKFKTVRMEIIFSRNVKKDEMPYFTFLCDILTDASRDYKSRKEISIKLEELYKSVFYGSTNKVGNMFTISFNLEFIAPKYINEEKYLEKVLKFPFEIINNPKVKNKEFDLTNFNIVKRRTLQEIKAIKENSDKLAIHEGLKAMDKNSPSSYRIIGTEEEIEKITPANLYEYYEELFNHSNCDIFIIGDINMDEATNIIKNNFKNHVIKLNTIDLHVDNILRKKEIHEIKESNFIQSSLVMIYNINNLTADEMNTNFHVFNYIFGSGGITSKLYQRLRNEKSLCYSVRSLYLKYDGLLLIEVSLDNENVKTAEKIIQKCVQEMAKGEFSEETITDAKKNLTFSLKMGSDNNATLLNNYVFNIFDNLPFIDKRIELINNTTKKDIIKCAKSLKLNTIFIQKSGDKND